MVYHNTMSTRYSTRYSTTKDRLAAGVKALESVDCARERRGDARIGCWIEHQVIQRELLELECLMFDDLRAVVRR